MGKRSKDTVKPVPHISAEPSSSSSGARVDSPSPALPKELPELAAGQKLSLESSSLSRRDFLSTSSWALAACGIASAVGLARFVSPETTELESRFALGTPADFKMRTVTWLRDKGLFVVRDDNGFGAFSSKCTHLGCTVRRTADGFACPCHGARYDSDGRVLSGPARKALAWYRVWQEDDGTIWVDTKHEASIGTVHLTKLIDPNSGSVSGSIGPVKDSRNGKSGK